MNHSPSIQDHYTIFNMPDRIESAFMQAGLGSGLIDWRTLAQLDQFHVRGLLATKDLAQGLELKGGENILDVGSGLGGPARYLAAVHGCHVTGIELTKQFVELANYLSQRTALADHTTFIHGDALHMPFEPDRFDHAWTQHVGMNIQDKEGLYKEIYRVLKIGGRLAIYDVVKGATEGVMYPLPWATDESMSFLVKPSDMLQALTAAGFQEVSVTDTTNLGMTWFAEVQRARKTAEGMNPLDLSNVSGPGFIEATSNLARNIQQGHLQLIQIIVHKI